MTDRPWTPREMRLISEWVAQAHPGGTIIMRARVGAIEPAVAAETLTPEELARVGAARRWVDALVITPDFLELYEAKLRLSPGALAQLELYSKLLPLTPDYAAYLSRPIRLHLVYAIPDAAVEGLARDKGILLHPFRPPWLEDYFATLRPRDRTPTRPGGLQGSLLPPAEPEES